MEKRRGEVYVKCHVASAAAAQESVRGNGVRPVSRNREISDGEEGDEDF